MNKLLCNLLAQDMSASLVWLMIGSRRGNKSMQMRWIFFVCVCVCACSVNKMDCDECGKGGSLTNDDDDRRPTK